MRIFPGQCFVCDAEIKRGGQPKSNFVQFEFMTDMGEILPIACCDKCEVRMEDGPEAIEAINEAIGGVIKGTEFVKFIGKFTLIDIVRESQGGKCSCGKKLTDKWVMNNGRMICEFCKGKSGLQEEAALSKKPTMADYAKVKPTKQGQKARKSKPKIQRVERKNVKMQSLRGEGFGNPVSKGASEGLGVEGDVVRGGSGGESESVGDNKGKES